MSLTTDRNDPKLKDGQKNETGQHDIYLILSDEERAKGFVRPYRDSYVHVGNRPKYPLTDLTEEQKDQLKDTEYTKWEKYPESEYPKTGRYWTDAQLKKGCGTLTRMAQPIAETYARDPKFYGATYCVGCKKHIPVSEFVWDGTNEEVGS